MCRPPLTPPLFPYTTLFRSSAPKDVRTVTPSRRGPSSPAAARAARIIARPPLACTVSSSTPRRPAFSTACARSEEHTSELQSLRHLVCRLLLEKKKIEHTNH